MVRDVNGWSRGDVFGEFNGDGIQRMANWIWVWCNIVVGQFLLICSSAFPEIPGEMIESLFA